MKLKNKLLISILTMAIILFALPLISTNFTKPENGMSLMMILFFGINPITIICLSIAIGKDIKKLYWVPLLFSIVFLLSYWIILKQVIIDLTIYAIFYLLLGIIAMSISFFINKKVNKSMQ